MVKNNPGYLSDDVLLKYSRAHKWFDGKLSMEINHDKPPIHDVCNWLYFLA